MHKKTKSSGRKLLRLVAVNHEVVTDKYTYTWASAGGGEEKGGAFLFLDFGWALLS